MKYVEYVVMRKSSSDKKWNAWSSAATLKDAKKIFDNDLKHGYPGYKYRLVKLECTKVIKESRCSSNTW